MKKIKPWVAGVGLCAVGAPAFALDVVLGFEGINHGAQVLSYYGGGISLPASPGGSSLGVNFLSGSFDALLADTPAPAVAMKNGTTTEPALFAFSTAGSQGLNTVGNLTVMSSGGQRSESPESSFAVMNVSAGINLSTLSFWYSSEQNAVTDQSGVVIAGARVEAFSGLDGTGTSLGLVSIMTQSQVGCTNANLDPRFCNWTFVDFSSSTQSARSLAFYNDANNTSLTLYDNISFSTSDVVPPPVPEPSTYALMALGLAGMAMYSRRRRQN